MKLVKFSILGLFLLLIPSISLGQDLSDLFATETAPGEFISFDVTQLKYDPYPAEQGKYVTLWLEIYNTATTTAENVVFELLPEYPFILDANEVATREFSSVPGLYTIVLQYKIRVDKDAVEGMNEISFRYKIGDETWMKKETEIYITEPPNKAELKVFYVGTEPKTYPGGETTLSVDLANIASGSAYYIIVDAESEVAEIEVNEIFIGTMDADDFDTIDFKLKIKENVKPGRYPVTIKSYYKDEDDKVYESEDTVYIKVYNAEEAMQELQVETPWWQYLAYIMVALIIIKYFITPAVKKTISFFRKKKK